MAMMDKSISESATEDGLIQKVWRNRSWWLLPLLVLILLILAAYVLGHLSAADPETYPTTLLRNSSTSMKC